MDKNTLTHIDADGRARMVDVSNKDITKRVAVACGSVVMAEKTFEILRQGKSRKGDVLSIAELAAIMGAKRTSDLIPLCHPLPLSKVKAEVTLKPDLPGVTVKVETKTTGQTGVEMEALTGVSVACLTIYDMLKAVDRAMMIVDIKLTHKSGGASGDWALKDLQSAEGV